MRIAALFHKYVGVNGHHAGAEWMAHSMFKWLVARGHEVRVVIGAGSPCIVDGVIVEDLNQTDDAFAWCDVAFTHLDLTKDAMAAALKAGKPLIHIVHNHEQLRFHKVKQADLVVFNSHWLAKRVAWAGPSMVLHPPVFAEDYRCTPGQAVTLVNISRPKGSLIFWNLARMEPKRAFLGVRGAYGVQHIPNHGTRNVRIMAQTPDARDFYSQTRVLLMPSAYESYGRVAVEAACSGIPTLAAPTPGLLESLGDAGIFVDNAAQAHSWRRHLRKLDDPDIYAEASARCRVLAESLRPDDDLRRLEERLQALVGSSCLMGYPMTWNRLVNRNKLLGDYSHNKPDDTNKGTPLALCNIAGDMRRLEHDTLDEMHLELYAKIGGCDRLTAQRILAAFFSQSPHMVKPPD